MGDDKVIENGSHRTEPLPEPGAIVQGHAAGFNEQRRPVRCQLVALHVSFLGGLIAASLLCLAACDRRPADRARSNAPESAASAASQAPASSAEASSPTLLTWNAFKAKAGFDEATPEEQVLIWELYRDQFLPANAADQGVTVDELKRRFEAQIPRPTQGQASNERFFGARCTQDCSGHEAGYDWAADNDISDPDQCTGDSQAFVEGCQDYAEERRETSSNAENQIAGGDERNRR
ncbi:hypothetical protein [Cupriavidus sp. AcVe19-1a]|uniref:hypothetical protein n=1 Tax=Cupriavidus sp. AcVe19-1a TaxID=2821359 RepID=UPI001AEA2748|nr:hypothetical protein [Cupriavidus sp. AcVe19-1a]MBP0630704.1 hypothetical protein [Cupriavidus sp. AcVe19-1a]